MTACLLAFCSAISATPTRTHAALMARNTSSSNAPDPDPSPISVPTLGFRGGLPAGGPVLSQGEIGPGKLDFSGAKWTCGDVVYTPAAIKKTGDWVLSNKFGNGLRDPVLSPPDNTSSATLDPRFGKPYSYPWAVSAYNAHGSDSKIFTLDGNRERRDFLKLESWCTLFPSDTQILFPIMEDGSIYGQGKTGAAAVAGPDRILIDRKGPGHDRLLFDRKGNFCALLTDRGNAPYSFKSCYSQAEKNAVITGVNDNPDFPKNG